MYVVALERPHLDANMYSQTVRTFYYSRGTQIYCAPTVDARPLWQHTMTHIALEGRCFVLSACQFSQEKDFPPDHAVKDSTNRHPDNVMIAGGSVIISPLGKVLAGPLLGEEGVLTAELDLDDIVRGKFDLDCVGHYARPDSKYLTKLRPLKTIQPMPLFSLPSPSVGCVKATGDHRGLAYVGIMY
jgi:predicted amidohydrolase